MILKTDTKHRHGVKVTLPGVGTVTPSKEHGVFESDDEAGVKKLLHHVKDFYLVEKTENGYVKIEPDEEEEDLKNKSETSTVKPLVTGEGNKGGDANMQLALTEEEVATLGDNTKADLETLCKIFPSKEWRGKNKGELVEYIKSKLA